MGGETFGGTQTEATVRLAWTKIRMLGPFLTALPAVREPSDSIALLLGPEGGSHGQRACADSRSTMAGLFTWVDDTAR